MKDFDKVRGEIKYDKIELIGGIVRIPKIQDIIKEHY